MSVNHAVQFLFTWEQTAVCPIVSAIQVSIHEEKVQSYLVTEEAADLVD